MSASVGSRRFDYRPRPGRGRIVTAVVLSAVAFGCLALCISTFGWRESAGASVLFALLASVPWVIVSSWTERTVLVTSDRIIVHHTSTGWWTRPRTTKTLDVAWSEVRAVSEIASRDSAGEPARHCLMIGSYAIRDRDLGCVGRTGDYAGLVAAVRDAIGDRLVERTAGHRPAAGSPTSG